jgi:hypothetical protein
VRPQTLESRGPKLVSRTKNGKRRQPTVDPSKMAGGRSTGAGQQRMLYAVDTGVWVLRCSGSEATATIAVLLLGHGLVGVGMHQPTSHQRM